MKKILLASAAVALTAGTASADGLSISGYARFGVVYNNHATNKAQVTSRFRLNVAATKTTDSGVEFGAKFRLQGDQGGIAAGSRITNQTPNAPTFWAKSGPFTLQVGNVSDAIDNSGTYYAGDLGLLAWGDQEVLAYGTSFLPYNSSAYSAVVAGTTTAGNQVGVLATYAANGLTVNLSYMNPDQAVSGQNKESAISVDYTMGAFAFGAGYVHNGGYTASNNSSFVSAQYSFGKSAVGLQYGHNGAAALSAGGNRIGSMYTLYGNTSLANGIGLQAYVTKDNNPANSTGVGLGMSYDLGGAKLLGSIARFRNKDTQADFGVKFTF